MGAFTAPVRRKETARGHHYVDGAGQRIPGVTTILGDGVPKPALVNWAANSTAEYAIDNWDQLAGKPQSVRLKELQGARWAVKDAAANKGTAVHALAEQLVKGESVDAPDEIAGHVESYARFLDEFQVVAVHVEFSVYSLRHGYAGTADLIADLTHPDLGRVRWLLDLKTNRSGIFGETAWQLAAYRHAERLLRADGTDEPMPRVAGCGAIHVRGDGYDLIPVAAGEVEFRQFLYIQQVAMATKQSRDLVGAPVTPPTTSTYRLTRSAP